MIFDLVKDFREVLDAMPSEHPRHRILKLLDEAIRRDIHFIDRHPTTFFQCMWNTCSSFDSTIDERDRQETTLYEEQLPNLAFLLKCWRAHREQSLLGFWWLRSVCPPAVPLGSPQPMLLTGGFHSARRIAWSPDGGTLVSSASDSIRIWDTTTGAQCGDFEGRANELCFSPDGSKIVAAFGYKRSELRILHATTLEAIIVMPGHEQMISSVAFSHDGTKVLSASYDKTMRLWDADTGTEIRQFQGHERELTCCSFSPDGAHIVSGSHDRTIRIWDLHTGEAVQTLQGHKLPVSSVSYSSDGKKILSSGFDRTIRVWDAIHGTPVNVINGHDREVTNACYSPDGRRIVSSSVDETVRQWDASSGTLLAKFTGHEASVACAQYSPNGERIASVSDLTVRIWDTFGETNIIDPPLHECGINSLAFCPDGSRIASSDSSTLVVLDANSNRVLLRTDENSLPASMSIFSADSKWVLTSWYHRICVHAIDSEDRIQIDHGHTGPIRAAAFSPVGTYLVTASVDLDLRVFDYATGDQVAVLRGHHGPINCAEWASDGRHLVTGAVDGSVRVWDALNGTEIAVLNSDIAHVCDAHFSKLEKIWPDEVSKASKSYSEPIQVDISDDNKWVLAVFRHRAVRWWRLADEQMQPYGSECGSHVDEARFSVDSTCVAVKRDSRNVATWDLESGDLLHQAMVHDVDLISFASSFRDTRFCLATQSLSTDGVVGESVAKEFSLTGQTAAWLPEEVRLIASHPHARLWAVSTTGNHRQIRIFALEGGPAQTEIH